MSENLELPRNTLMIYKQNISVTVNDACNKWYTFDTKTKTLPASPLKSPIDNTYFDAGSPTKNV